MPRFLPVLRGESMTPVRVEGKSALPTAFGEYYSALAAYNVHRRAQNWPIERAITEGFDRVMWVFKCVNTIAADSARLPFQLREGEEVVDDHPLYRVLNKKANPLETGQVFRKRLSAQVLLSKRGAFVEMTLSNGGTIKRLDLLPPDRTEIIPGTGDDLIDHFRLARRDGTYKNIDPEKVRWFRDPHPLDPYSGVTPLESAGMSVELDHFARMYNVAFLQNDGRPGGVLAVRKTDGQGGDIDERQMDRIEDRFGKGPTEAGKLSVIAGDLSYVDLAARPRDMQYGALSRNSKIELLSAFGVPESVLGYSAERTYDNADAELYNYWTRTMPAHNEILLTGFDEDSEDELEGFLDTSSIEVLERAERAKREEARTEFDKGLRSIYSYAKLAGYEDEIDETVHTRALYVAAGRTPLPSREEDAEALGLAPPSDPGAAPVEGGAPPAELPPGQDQPGGEVAPSEEMDGIDTEALAAARGSAPDAPTPPALPATKTRLRAIEGGHAPKARAEYRLTRSEKAAQDVTESTPDLRAADELEDALAAVLASLAERWTERAAVRIGSPKQRKHTRHWTPEYETDTRVGTKALDAAKGVDEETWQEEAEEQAAPIVEAAAIAAAIALLADAGIKAPPGMSLPDLAREIVTETVEHVVRLIGRSAARQARKLVALVNDRDQAGDPLTDIVAGVRDFAGRMASWTRGLATHAATATTNGSRDAAARDAETSSWRGDEDAPVDTGAEHGPIERIDRVWFSRRDERVRHSHDRETGADGQIRGLDEPFIVGESLLRFPGDPLAPMHEIANCRCYLRYRIQRTGRWTRRPREAAAL